MPIYEFECSTCGARKEDLFRVAEKPAVLPCGWCVGGMMFTLPSAARPKLFKPFWAEHVAKEPVLIETKQQLKELCKKTGKKSDYLEQSPL